MKKTEPLLCLRARCMYPDGFTRRPARITKGRCPRCGALHFEAADPD